MSEPTQEEILLSKMSPMEVAAFNDGIVSGKQKFVEGLTLHKIHSAVAAQKEMDAEIAEQNACRPDNCLAGCLNPACWPSRHVAAAIRAGGLEPKERGPDE